MLDVSQRDGGLATGRLDRRATREARSSQACSQFRRWILTAFSLLRTSILIDRRQQQHRIHRLFARHLQTGGGV